MARPRGISVYVYSKLGHFILQESQESTMQNMECHVVVDTVNRCYALFQYSIKFEEPIYKNQLLHAEAMAACC